MMSTSVRPLAACAMFLVAVAHAACSPSDRTLENRIDAEVRKGAGTLVRIAALTEFSWERLHVFAPYVSQEVIDRELGFAWPAAAGTGISDNDAIALLVFVKSGAVVRYVAHPRAKGDFAQVKIPGGLSPAEAVFVVQIESDGRPVLQPDVASRSGGE